MYIEVDEGLPEHPKSNRLCALLRNPLAWAYVIKLWRWCCKYAKDGDLSKFEDAEIEYGIGWSGKPGQLLEAMRTAGFVDAERRVHDWMNHQGKAIERMDAAAERKKNWRLSRAAERSVDADAAQDGTQDGTETPRRTAGVPSLTKTNQVKSKEESTSAPPPRERFNFAAVYASYPRRKGDPGKKDGLDICGRKIKTRGDYDRLAEAVKRYAVERKDDIGTPYIPKFSTWMGSWTDFAEPTQPALALAPNPDADEAERRRLEEITKQDAKRYAELTR